jgi:HEPN domain-containing protein
MPPDVGDPGDSGTWLRMAREDLALAQAQVPGVGYGLLCFHAQQAAEKGIKAVLLERAVSFPYIHDLGRLLDIARAANVTIPAEVRDADLLTDYATLARYPGTGEIEEPDHVRAVATARAVISWAERQLSGSS